MDSRKTSAAESFPNNDAIVVITTFDMVRYENIYGDNKTHRDISKAILTMTSNEPKITIAVFERDKVNENTAIRRLNLQL